MKIIQRTLLLIVLILSAITQVPVSSAYAETRSVQIEIPSPLEPENAVALFTSGGGTKQLPVQSLERAANGSILATVSFSEKDAPKDAMVTVMVTSADGQVAYGNVQQAFAANTGESWLSIPPCAPEKISDVTIASQMGLIESLIAVRSERRKVAQLALTKILTPEFQAKLTALEKGFGFNNLQPIKPSTPPVLLIERLTRILETVKAYDASRKAATAGAQH